MCLSLTQAHIPMHLIFPASSHAKTLIIFIPLSRHSALRFISLSQSFPLISAAICTANLRLTADIDTHFHLVPLSLASKSMSPIWFKAKKFNKVYYRFTTPRSCGHFSILYFYLWSGPPSLISLRLLLPHPLPWSSSVMHPRVRTAASIIKTSSRKQTIDVPLTQPALHTEGRRLQSPPLALTTVPA